MATYDDGREFGVWSQTPAGERLHQHLRMRRRVRALLPAGRLGLLHRPPAQSVVLLRSAVYGPYKNVRLREAFTDGFLWLVTVMLAGVAICGACVGVLLWALCFSATPSMLF